MFSKVKYEEGVSLVTAGLLTAFLAYQTLNDHWKGTANTSNVSAVTSYEISDSSAGSLEAALENEAALWLSNIGTDVSSYMCVDLGTNVDGLFEANYSQIGSKSDLRSLLYSE